MAVVTTTPLGAGVAQHGQALPSHAMPHPPSLPLQPGAAPAPAAQHALAFGHQHYYGGYAMMWPPQPPPMGPQEAAILNTMASTGNAATNASLLDFLTRRMMPAPPFPYGYAPPPNPNMPPAPGP